MRVAPLTFDDHVWNVTDEGASRAERERESGPYRSAVTPELSDLELVLPGAIAANIGEATVALAKFDVYATTILGAGELAPMSAILLRTESASSSNIEQITAGAQQIALAEIGESGSENANLVVGNVRAMEAALELADDLSVDSILRMHARLLAHEPQWAGRYRDGLVWVGGDKLGPRRATHVAPQRELVVDAMTDLVQFMARNDLPPLAQAAIAHAQFETIHPFADGNGRTGRALVHAILRGKEVVTRATAPVSAGLLRNTGDYFAALTAYREGNASPIIAQFADASRFAAARGRRLVDDLAQQTRESEERIVDIRADAAARRVIPLLVGQPVVNVAYIQKRLDLNERAAFRAIDALVTRGILVERAGRSRNRVYAHRGILGVLDSFAADIRRG
ncbi:Fic family protein [Homoserinibacter gongjuensis]|uniref:Fic family protein n=1 Tax=Homoserinibacter gongjuensis TaxID=1162968 RepID=A0ABQ6JTU4_9MICO|nr:Fic family protein [Homoserinibacter gongjuensis]